jgi:hypothetical protein
MQACPWCKNPTTDRVGETKFPSRCPRCTRGIKLDWVYCPWCYGTKIGPQKTRRYSDRRYVGKCTNPHCSRKSLLPFMRYCPWCRTKVRKRWALGDARDTCPGCDQRIARGFWSCCAWCGTDLDTR